MSDERGLSLKTRLAVVAFSGAAMAAMPFGLQRWIDSNRPTGYAAVQIEKARIVRKTIESSLENQINASVLDVPKSGSRIFNIQAQGSLDMDKITQEAVANLKKQDDDSARFTRIASALCAPLMMFAMWAVSGAPSRRRETEPAAPQP